MAAGGKEARSRYMAREIIVSDFSNNASGDYSSNLGSFPRRRTMAHNDGRNDRAQRYNMEFCMSGCASLPPLIGTYRSVNVDRLEISYSVTTRSVTHLAQQNNMRGINKIDRNIVYSMREK